MRQLLLLVVLTLVVCSGGVALRCPLANAEQSKMQVASVAPLEGTKWSIKLTPDAMAKQKGEKSSKDTLTFRNGTLTSTACVKYGFTASPYTTARSGAAWSFNTEQLSKKDGKTAWTGQVSGGAITGTMTWTKLDGSVLRYSFEGKRSARSGRT